MSRKDFKKRAVELKGGKCIICGYARCIAALQFHHLDDFLKDIEVSSCSTWQLVEDELPKCVLLCSNCHVEAHQHMIDPEYLAELDDLI